MYLFTDFYNNKVTLSFEDHPFSKSPKHVLVICKFKDRWLLTKHKERGLEFPGGKVEKGETAKQGAIREVREETGGIVGSIMYIGQYYVAGKREQIVKNIYYAEIKTIEERQNYFETEGPVLLKNISKNVKNDPSYSFIMKDDVMQYCLKYIEQK